MAATKKKPESKKEDKTKKTAFFPKVRSTKRNGLGSY